VEDQKRERSNKKTSVRLKSAMKVINQIGRSLFFSFLVSRSKEEREESFLTIG